MSRALIPCPSCHRHVLAEEPRCPFCAKSMPTLSRRSLAALTAASLGLAVSGCPERPRAKYGMPPQPAPEPPPEKAGPPDDAPLYGMPAPSTTATPDAPEPKEAKPKDDELARPMYGMPRDE